MGLDHEERKATADEKAEPEFYYSYVLRFEDDGDFYVGSTNNPAARFTEHAVGVGAVATSGRRFTVCLVHQFGSRKEAEYNEERIRSALAKGPVNVEAMIDNFNRISMMIRPEKTFSQLRKEEEAFISEMSRVFHFSTALVWNPGGPPATACGFAGGPIGGGKIGYYSTNSWESLIQQAREEDALAAVGGSPKDREVCRRCLALAPLNSPVAGP